MHPLDVRSGRISGPAVIIRSRQPAGCLAEHPGIVVRNILTVGVEPAEEGQDTENAYGGQNFRQAEEIVVHGLPRFVSGHARP